MFRDFKAEGRIDLGISEYVECKFREKNFNRTIRLHEIPNVWIPKHNIPQQIGRAHV